jgi:branched-chain amino acid transport system ATP-binding protein
MATDTTAPGGAASTIVQLRSVTVRFGGLLALGGVDLDVARASAGHPRPQRRRQDHLFNVVAGDLVPTDGSVVIKGVDSTRLPSRHRPRLGRRPHLPEGPVVPGLSVADNLYLAVVGRRGRHLSLWRTAATRSTASGPVPPPRRCGWSATCRRR